MKRNCSGCANFTGKDCLTMTGPPRERFCYKTLEDAIQAEYDMVDYASRTQPPSELSSYKDKHKKRIKELEAIHARRI